MSLVPGFDPRYRQILFVWDLSRARGGRCFGEGWGGCPWHIRREQGKIKVTIFICSPWFLPFRFLELRGPVVSSVHSFGFRLVRRMTKDFMGEDPIKGDAKHGGQQLDDVV